MISPQIFEKHKCRSEDLRPLFEAEEKSEKVSKLVCLIKDRISSGRDRNLKDWPTFAALDCAYDAPFAQLTPTLTRFLESKCSSRKTPMEYDEVMSMLDAFGVPKNDLFYEAKNEKGDVIGLVPNAPTFVKVLVPLVRAYVSIRLAKLFTDRDQTPLFKYEPLKMTQANQVRTEVVTDIVAAMSAHFGYSSDLRDAILHTLLYGTCLMFPREAWYHESHEDPDGKDYTTKEGLRYHRPHPTRVFHDLHHPISSVNTDTGVDHAGYWGILKFSDVSCSDLYWNRDAVTYGQDWFAKKGAKYYLQEFYPSAMKFPAYDTHRDSDREGRADHYSESDHDKAVFVSHVFMKLTPSKYGLGTYTKPIWFRFVVASDDTVIYAEPLAYCPVIYFGYDADDGRDRNASLGLELVPFQDIVGNTLSQILLTTRQNLASISLYDDFVIDSDIIRKLQNSGELSMRGLNFVPFNSVKMTRGAQGDPKSAIHTVQLAKVSTAEMVSSLTTLIGIMERVLQFSAQEVGSAASHQQSAQEIRIIANNTSVRVAYTGAFIDDAIDAWKRQLYHAMVAYMDEDFIAQVSTDNDNLDEVTQSIGFEVSERTGGRAIVKGSVRKLLLEGFASTKDGPDRGIDAGTASTMLQGITQVSSHPAVAQSMDVKSLLKMLSRAFQLAGAPKDFDLTDLVSSSPAAGSTDQAAGQAEALMQQVEETVAKPTAEALQIQGQQIQELQQVMQVLAKQFASAGQAPPAPAPNALDAVIQAAPVV